LALVFVKGNQKAKGYLDILYAVRRLVYGYLSLNKFIFQDINVLVLPQNTAQKQ